MEDLYKLLLESPMPGPIAPQCWGESPVTEFCTAGGGRPTSEAVAVPRVDASQLSVADFVRLYMHPNLPVIITGMVSSWPAYKNWVTPEGTVDVEYLSKHFGSAHVLVTDTAAHHAGGGPCTEMLLADVISAWQQQQQLGTSDCAAASDSVGGSGSGNAKQPVLYIKDWHLFSEFPSHAMDYSCPDFFSDDWLNSWLDHLAAERQGERPAAAGGGAPDRAVAVAATAAPSGAPTSDYRFVYVGPAGSGTPLHADVMRSFSWSVNVAGRKRWRLLPPGLAHLVHDASGRAAAPSFDADLRSPEAAARFPRLPEARAQVLEVEQGPGEAIFVPSGWFHAVDNLSAGGVISVNHNWFNAHNVHWVWALLEREYGQAARGIEDCRGLCTPAEFESLVQRNLGANAGLDLLQLGALLRFVAHGAAAAATERCPGARPAAGDAAAPALALALRLRAAGAVLQRLLALMRGVDAAAAAAAAAAEPPYAAEVQANAACLEQVHAALARLGLGHVLPRQP